MQWRTLIVNPENWVLGESPVKDAMLWAISDMPWLHIRTHGGITATQFPFQLKTESWTSVTVNKDAVPFQETVDLTNKIKKRIALLQELYYRLEIAHQNLGLGNANYTIVDFYHYLVSKGLVEGEAPDDSQIVFENKIQTMKHLDQIKRATVTECLACTTDEDYAQAKKNMERLFFTNILL
jgi:hypothetical protein